MTSVISAKFYSCIKDSNCKLKQIDSEIRGITNNRAKTLGICTLPIKFCNARNNRPHVKVEHSFYVIEGISVDCLIGLDFLSLYEGNVDIVSRMLTLNTNIGMSRHALVGQEYNNQPVPVHVTKQYTIPARSQMLIKGCLSKELCDVYEDWCDVTQVAITPSHQMHERFNLLVANCITPLSAISASVILHVMNTTNDDIILHSGIECGTAEPCDDNNNIYYVNADGYRLDAHDETDADLTPERHVHFADEVRDNKPTRSDDDSRPIYSKSDLTKTKAWIKSSGLDIDLSQISEEQQTEILPIDLVEGARPVKLSPSRATPDKRKIIEKETRQMLADVTPATTHSTTADSSDLLRVNVNKSGVQTSIAEQAGPLSIEEIIDAQQADATLHRLRDNSASEETISSTLRTLHRRIDDIFEDDGV